MRVLIIGGTGVISSGITPLLLRRGDEVVLYNRGASGVEFEGGFELVRGDRNDFAQFETAMKRQRPFDCVVDMIGFVPAQVESDIRAFRGRTGQFIFCSTVDVYQKPARRYPITESEPRRAVPEFRYAYDKVACERLLEAAYHPSDFPLTIIRPAHTYVRRLVHTLRGGTYWVDRLRRGMPVICHGDGQSLWGSCHRDDVAKAFVNAIGNRKAIGEDYHVTGEEWMTWDQIYAHIADAAGGPPPELVHIPTDLLVRAVPEAEWCGLNFQYDNIFDNSKAHRDLGFEYTVQFPEGSRSAVQALLQRGEVENADAHTWYDDVISEWRAMSGRFASALQAARAPNTPGG
ncbi:MAG: NAD-dependent epimerase/dehydratase family protein [SAR202 cluster bacterium]|nr:NAD-dependent epimerase/dehydratase family protein [SAR202 cluster bacterium]